MKSTIVLNQATQVLFLSAFLSVRIAAYAQLQIHREKNDTLSILDGRLKIILKNETFTPLTTDHLIVKYARMFCNGEVLGAHGVVLHGTDTLTFYQTSIHRPKEAGISIWNIIDTFTRRIADSEWVESGWNRTKNDYIYFVSIIDGKTPAQFLKFNFFFVDDKFTFSLRQSPILEHENYSIISSN